MRLRSGLVAFFAAALPACAALPVRPASPPLTNNQLIDIANHPEKWNGRVAWLLAFPFDNGFSESAPICFEPCGAAEAANSPYLIYTKADRFKHYLGSKQELLHIRINTSCAYREHQICPDSHYVLFTEVEEDHAR